MVPISELWAFCHKNQRVALAAIPRGFLQWGEEEEEEEDEDVAWLGKVMETLLAAGGDVPETFPALCFRQDVNVSHSRSAL